MFLLHCDSLYRGFHISCPQWAGGGGPQKADKRNKISWFVTLTRGVILRTSYMEAPYLGAQLSKRIRKCFPRKSAGLIFLRRLHCEECRQRRCGVVITLMAPLGLIYPSMWKTPAELLGARGKPHSSECSSEPHNLINWRPPVRSVFCPKKVDLTSGLTLHPGYNQGGPDRGSKW